MPPGRRQGPPGRCRGDRRRRGDGVVEAGRRRRALRRRREAQGRVLQDLHAGREGHLLQGLRPRQRRDPPLPGPGPGRRLLVVGRRRPPVLRRPVGHRQAQGLREGRRQVGRALLGPRARSDPLRGRRPPGVRLQDLHAGLREGVLHRDGPVQRRVLQLPGPGVERIVLVALLRRRPGGVHNFGHADYG